MFCSLPNNSSAAPKDTKLGITALSRAGSDNVDNWPMSRKGGHLALEAETKGFVINRMTTAQITAIANPVVGMLVYDTDLNCLKSYVQTDSPSVGSKEWKCMNQTGCPTGEAYNR